jgi:hypothetical protein
MNVESAELLRGSPEARGSWPTAAAALVALVPLGVGLAIGIAMDGRSSLGPLTASQLAWFVLVPLAVIYPAVASFARIQAYAPTTVLIVAAIAPAFALAARLLLEPLSLDRQGQASVQLTDVLQRALPPAILAVAAFLAIEITTAGMRRGILLGIVGWIAGAAVLGAFALAIVVVLAVPIWW